ncbi:MAG: hypothetical protein AB3N10_13390 [Allomuricauda sp.]
MKKSTLVWLWLVTLTIGCSVDAIKMAETLEATKDSPEVVKSSECFSCIAQNGFKLEICDNMDDTYTLFLAGENMKTIGPEELEGKTPKEFVAEGCQLDRLDFAE